MTQPMAMTMTKIKLLSIDHSKVLAEADLMWPPEDGEPDVILAASRTFVRVPDAKVPTYALARIIHVSNIDF